MRSSSALSNLCILTSVRSSTCPYILWFRPVGHLLVQERDFASQFHFTTRLLLRYAHKSSPTCLATLPNRHTSTSASTTSNHHHLPFHPVSSTLWHFTLPVSRIHAFRLRSISVCGSSELNQYVSIPAEERPVTDIPLPQSSIGAEHSSLFAPGLTRHSITVP
ncbi:hypothetical protein F5Y15DRAFT_38493 [Xylariaceae sp. FL0016]|nr:hypothetical protein F5Y15DRAFT_38493 [Xylariaceae sp. FL0016]